MYNLDWSKLQKFSIDDQKRIMDAVRFACQAHFGQRRKSKIKGIVCKGDGPRNYEPYFLHPLEVAHICLESKGDATEIISAILHDVVEDTSVTLKDIEDKFGSDVARIVDGVTKIPAVYGRNKSDLEEATLRKVVIATISDIRIIRIKLADRLHNMRTLESMKREKQIIKSRETLDTFVPVAKQIGAYKIARELEDLAFFYLEPDKYKDSKEKWELMKDTYSQHLNNLYASFKRELGASSLVEDIRIEFSNVYSFYKRLGGITDGIDELVTIKVIVKDLEACYRILGLINTHFHVNSVLKDYIGCPEDNGYQSLHTTLFNPKNDNPRTILVKIRTREMDELAAYGITSEMYSSNKTYASVLAKLFGSVDDICSSDKEFLLQLKHDLIASKIHVFTPSGEMKTIKEGYTIIDFAYLIHSELGDHISGAYVGKEYIPKTGLTRVLKDGDEVKILTGRDERPYYHWINEVSSSNAKKRILRFYNKQLRD